MARDFAIAIHSVKEEREGNDTSLNPLQPLVFLHQSQYDTIILNPILSCVDNSDTNLKKFERSWDRKTLT
jgi:hypothetical protein